MVKANDEFRILKKKNLIEVRKRNDFKSKNGGMGNSTITFSHIIISLRPVMPGQ